MNKFYVLHQKRPKPELHASLSCILVDERGGPIPNPFNDGKKVSPNHFFLKVKVDDSEIGNLGDKLSLSIHYSDTLLVVSQKLKASLEKLPDDLQFHPTKVIIENNEYPDYFIVNILQVVDAIDYQKSKLIYYDESHSTVYHIDDLVLNYQVIPDQFNIFLLGNLKGLVVILITNRLKEELEKNDISGINLYRPEDFVI